MAEYHIKQGGNLCETYNDLNEAIAQAVARLTNLPEGEYATFTVEYDFGRLLASVTNRRIIGSFNKQQWGGRKGDDAIFIGQESFDATDAVLLMEYERLLELADSAESSDQLGYEHVEWNGPCYVHIVDEVCRFFGVDDIREITPEALFYARDLAKPQKAVEEIVTLTVKVKVLVSPGAGVADFIENLDCSVASNTPGVKVRDTEIADAS